MFSPLSFSFLPFFFSLLSFYSLHCLPLLLDIESCMIPVLYSRSFIDVALAHKSLYHSYPFSSIFIHFYYIQPGFLASWPPGLLASWPPGLLASWLPGFQDSTQRTGRIETNRSIWRRVSVGD